MAGAGPSRWAAVLAAALKAWPAGSAVAVTTPVVTLATAGAIGTVRPWASVTKLLTALATLVAVEEGTVGLDEAAGPPGSTVRHLLAHASGLAPEGDTVIAPPASRRIYSNRGFELVGATLATAAGMPFADYLHAGVLDPLGLQATSLAGSPAAGASGSLADLVLLARELSAPTLISAATLREATTVAFPNLDGILPGFGVQRPNDWGLGFEIRSHKHPHWTGGSNSPETFGHFGRSGSFLWIDPVAGLACAALAGQPYGPWANEAWPALADAVLAVAGG